MNSSPGIPPQVLACPVSSVVQLHEHSPAFAPELLSSLARIALGNAKEILVTKYQTREGDAKETVGKETWVRQKNANPIILPTKMGSLRMKGGWTNARVWS